MQQSRGRRNRRGGGGAGESNRNATNTFANNAAPTSSSNRTSKKSTDGDVVHERGNDHDILRPDLLWLDGCCYRVMPVRTAGQVTKTGSAHYEEDNMYEDEVECAGWCVVDDDDYKDAIELGLGKGSGNVHDDDTCGGYTNDGRSNNMSHSQTPSGDLVVNYDSLSDECLHRIAPISKNEHGRWTCSLPVAHAFFPHIIGRGGETKRKIEFDTQCDVFVPRRDAKPDEKIVIRGDGAGKVAQCRRRVMMLVDGSRIRQQYTHFISIPINTTEVMAKYREFRDIVLNEYQPDMNGISPSIFQDENKLHLTLCMLVTLDEFERAHAADALQQAVQLCKIDYPDVFDSARLHVSGLQYMNDDPSAVDVLYAKCTYMPAERHNRFESFCAALVGELAKTGLTPRQNAIKLHITLMNTSFGRNADGQRITFNAAKILDELADFDFGQCTFDQVHMSARFTTDPNTKYYVSTRVVSMK